MPLRSPTVPYCVQEFPLRRHLLVWLFRAPRPDSSGEATVVERWHADRNPFIVCRQREGGDRLSLGFCSATPGMRPRRMAVQARSEDIASASLPPLLREVAVALAKKNSAPGTKASPANDPQVIEAFAMLSQAAEEAGLEIRVFGSWMWQALVGGFHVNESSDLDVLIDVADASRAGLAADFLQRMAADCPFKLDGELSLPGLGEIHWREYHNGQPAILLKSLNAVQMVQREDLWK